MSETNDFTRGALPIKTNASYVTLKLISMKVDDVIEVYPTELPSSYRGIKSLTDRISYEV